MTLKTVERWSTAANGSLVRRGRNLKDVDGFVSRVTMPVNKGLGHIDNNVGTRYGVNRSNYAGTINFANGPVSIKDLNITSLQTVVGANHSVDNCLVTSTYSGDAGGGQFNATASSVKNLKFTHTTFRGPVGDRYNALFGHDYTVERSIVERTVDAFGGYNQYAQAVNILIKDSWYGYLSWFNDDRAPATGAQNGHTDGSHNDGLQVHSGWYYTIIGSFLQGAKYNVNNPGNVVLNADGMGYTIANGNGVDLLANNSGNSSNRNPQSGQAFLGQHTASYEFSNVTFEDNWLWNWDHGFKLQSNRSSSLGGGYARINNAVCKRNKFGGVWRNWGGSLLHYPIRLDNNVQFNGVRYTGGAAYDDVDGNVWVGGPFAGQSVKLRVDAVTAV